MVGVLRNPFFGPLLAICSSTTGRIAGSGGDPSRSSIFLKLSADKLQVFRESQALVSFLKFT